MKVKYAIIIALTLLSLITHASAQKGNGKKEKEPPAYKLFRAEEDYLYLRQMRSLRYKADPFDPLKFIPLNRQRRIFLTLGGEYRPRFVYFRNDDWGEAPDENQTYYSQRLSLHTSLSLTRYLRIFGELYHGLLSKETKEITEDDDIDLHQGFLDIVFPTKRDQSLTIRLGRQEMAYGTARLVGLREGPNIRRSFDAVRVIFASSKMKPDGLFGSEVLVPFGAFDNKRNEQMKFWGVYSQLLFDVLSQGRNDIYYFGFSIDEAQYNDGVAEERRHSIGLRRWGKLGSNFRYNTEFIYQFGTFGDKDINAFAIEGDWHYQFINAKWKPEVGMKLDYISGDRKHGDDKLNTFNPLFNNPAYFGLLTKIAPMNLMDIHPSLRLEPSKKIVMIFDWDFFWRVSKEDGLYKPPRFLNREGHEAESRWIGHQPSLEISYLMSRHFKLTVETSYFIAGDFLQETGEAENIFYFASTFSFKF